MEKILIAIDWGGTFVKLGIFDFKGKILSKYELSSGDFAKPSKFFNLLKETIEEKFKEKKIKLSSLKGIGIGAPGIIDMKEGFIYYLPNIKGWENFPFKKVFKKKFGIPLALDNDANLAALAELKRGQAKGIERGILFTLGTGLGSGLILEGKVFRGKTSAAEAGHIPISLNGKICSCGSRGCIETFLGSRYLIKKTNKVLNHKILTPKQLYNLALKGDKKALKIWEDFGYILGTFSSGLINLLNPQIIILSGGVSKAYRFFIREMKRTIKRRVMYPLSKQVTIKKSKLENNAGIIGAFEFIKSELNGCK